MRAEADLEIALEAVLAIALCTVSDTTVSSGWLLHVMMFGTDLRAHDSLLIRTGWWERGCAEVGCLQQIPTAFAVPAALTTEH